MTTPAELGAQLTELQQQMTATRTEMEGLAQAFIAAAVTHVPALLPGIVERIVTEQPDAAAKAASEKLKKLKAGLKKVTEKAGERIRQALNRDERWMHRNTKPNLADHWAYHIHNDQYEVYESASAPSEQSAKRLQVELKEVAADLAPLLTAAGFVLKDERYGEWKNRYAGGTSQTVYTGRLAWSPTMLEEMKKYNDALQVLIKDQTNFDRIALTKKQVEAKLLWDEA